MSDFKETLNMLRPFYRGLPIIATTMFISVMIAKKYLNYTTPMYDSVSFVKLADAKIGISSSNLYRDLDVFANGNNKMGAEVEMVKSEVVAEKALEKVDLSVTVKRVGDLHKTELYNDCPFIITPVQIDPSGYDKPVSFTVKNDSLIDVLVAPKMMIHGKLNEWIKTPVATFYMRKNTEIIAVKKNLLINDTYELVFNSHKKLVDEIRKTVDVVYLDKETPILRIAYKSVSPQKSADIVNSIAQAYIDDYISEKYAAADTTVEFLKKEEKKYDTKLKSSENDMEYFRNKNSVINLKQESETNLRKLSELKNRKAGLQMDLVAIDSLDRYIKNGRKNFEELAPNFETFNDLLSTELIKKIKSLQSDRRDLLLKYTSTHPKVKVVDDKLNDIYKYMEESINNSRTNIQLKYDDLSNTINETEAEFATFPYKDRNMTILERNFNLNDHTYRFLKEKKTDAEIARAANMAFHRIISRGEVSVKPVSPNPSLLKAVAGFLGFAFGVALVYLIHFLKGRINNEITVLKNCDTPVFGRIPYVKKQSVYNKSFQKLAVDMQIKDMLNTSSVVVISSFGNLEGKRTIATGLARASVTLGKNVLLIDADHTMDVSLKNELNLVRLNDADPQWKKPEILKALIAKWRDSYDVIIFKNFPISQDPLSLLIMSEADSNLLAIDTRNTRLNKVVDADRLRVELGLSNIQFVIHRDGYTPSIFYEVFKVIRSISLKKPFINFNT